MPMTSKIIDSTSGLEEIITQIDVLYNQCVSPNPYFSSDWVKVWWKHYGVNNRPRILTVWENNRLLAFWPLYEMKVVTGTALWPMLYNVADFFDPLIHPQKSEETENELFDLYLKQVKNYTYIWSLVVRNSFFEKLSLASEKLKNKKLLNSTKTRLFIELEQTDYQKFLNEKLGTKSQKTLRYTRKKLEEGGNIEFKDFDDAEDVTSFLPETCTIEQASWKAEQGIGIYAMPGLRAFLFELLPILADKKQIRLSALYRNNEAIAYQLGLLAPNYYGLNCLTFKNNYSDFSPGRHLMLHTLERTFQEGRSIYDFMIGDQDYKQKFATHHEPLPALHIFQRSLKGWLNRKTIEANMKARRKS
jgi:CelD/BcsL family acetyltransferase involved in cellulose biosynthesis